MSHKTRLLLMALALRLLSSVCLGTGNIVFAVIGWLLVAASSLAFTIWFLLVIGVIADVEKPAQRCCPSCGSRHYLVYPRGSKFGFAFPARFVKVAKTDFHCQACGFEWSMTEIDEHDADY
ncbi:MAG: hypothetical protein WC505_01445 [Patescibacteria group bacterium]